ncbi:hypothetical protein [Frankia sp. AgPm24]|uniref:DUF6980 family protein n=1 Tax=Frankia sp. AgPm24 TaxID=631128 RepID=UPI00200CE917|nr:hypothetical protein [Frankia sp. AgPm24]
MPIGLDGPHCCAGLHDQVTFRCEDGHVEPQDCPDALVCFVPKFQEYGLRIHDGGDSSIMILHCPWCGTRLPDSARDDWFGSLERRGFDPAEDVLPPEYSDESWLRGL